VATSSKVKFNLETLKTKALESIDVRIAQAQDEVNSHEDPAALEKRIDEWRATQETRISDLFSRLGDGGIRDRELAEFRVQPMPDTSTRERYRAEGNLRELRSIRSQIVAKTGSLVPDEDGNISLTKTQLSEFFGL
jgi:hypothetical protein